MAGADLKILGELTNPVNLKITKPPSKGPNVWTWGALIVGMLAFIIPLILVWKFAEAMVISTDPATGDLVMRTRIVNHLIPILYGGMGLIALHPSLG